MVGANKSRFKPTVKAILERDYKKYRGKGGIEPGEADDPLLSGGKNDTKNLVRAWSWNERAIQNKIARASSRLQKHNAR